MSTLDARDDQSHEVEEARMGQLEGDGPSSPEEDGHGGHGRWLMIACCIPMLAIAIVLVATGVAGAGFIAVAVLCTAMMAMMMVGMSSGGGGGGEGR